LAAYHCRRDAGKPDAAKLVVGRGRSSDRLAPPQRVLAAVVPHNQLDVPQLRRAATFIFLSVFRYLFCFLFFSFSISLLAFGYVQKNKK
jgi:hypothetical protein